LKEDRLIPKIADKACTWGAVILFLIFFGLFFSSLRISRLLVIGFKWIGYLGSQAWAFLSTGFVKPAGDLGLVVIVTFIVCFMILGVRISEYRFFFLRKQ
jgi:hypothetical protein